MKNVKKLLQKAMVFTLAASMLVGTPLTASAAGIRGVYSVSDGTTDDIRGEGDNSHTGTVTNTNTSTRSGVLSDNEAKIIGIVLDKNYVNAVKGNKVDLKATIIYDGEVAEDVNAELEKKIVWEVRNFDGSTVGANNKLSIKVSAGDRTKAELNPRQGTVKGEDMVVSAKIDSSWYWATDDNGNKVVKKENVKDDPFEATVDVFIKEYSDSLELINMPKVTDENGVEKNVAYAKHTINLNTDEHLKRVPETANDDITWISTNTKAAKITAAGVVTFGAAGQSGKIMAVSEKGKTAEYVFTVDAGTPASKVVILDDEVEPKEPFKKNTTTVDLASIYETKIASDWDGDTKDVTVLMYAKVKNVVVSKDDAKKPASSLDDAKRKGNKDDGDLVTATLELKEDDEYYTPAADNKKAFSTDTPQSVHVTDVIAWSSNKKAFADVEAVYTDSDDATLTAKGVGTATITAKASGGKKATLKVIVKATLCKLEITNKEQELYSGQSLQMTYAKKPEESKDAVTWSIAKVKVDKKDKHGNVTGTKEVKNPNATINAKGVLTIKPKLDLSDDAYREVTVVLQSKKKLPNGEKDENDKAVTDYVSAIPVTFDLTQSSIDKIVVSDEAGPIAEVHTDNNKVQKANKDIDPKSRNTTTIYVPKNRSYDVTAFATTGLTDKNVDGIATTSTLTWKSSNTNIADFVNNGDSVKIIAKKKGTATMTVSGIRVTEKEGKVNKASVIKTTFKVNVLQPVKTVTLNKSSVVLNQKVKNVGKPTAQTQKQTVSFKATLGPTGVNKNTVVTWGVDASKATTTASINKGTLTMDAPVVGDEFVVTAKVPTGAYATATVKIVEKTNNVEIKNDEGSAFEEYDYKPNGDLKKTYKNTKWLTPGGSDLLDGSTHMNAWIDVKDAELKKAGTENREDVTYTVNKKGIVSIDDNGNVYALKAGTVKITAKTPLGKKATLTVVVK